MFYTFFSHIRLFSDLHKLIWLHHMAKLKEKKNPVFFNLDFVFLGVWVKMIHWHQNYLKWFECWARIQQQATAAVQSNGANVYFKLWPFKVIVFDADRLRLVLLMSGSIVGWIPTGEASLKEMHRSEILHEVSCCRKSGEESWSNITNIANSRMKRN